MSASGKAGTCPAHSDQLLTLLNLYHKFRFGQFDGKQPVIDHTTGPEHQLLFFKERFLPKDHPDRPKMDRSSAKLRKLGLREETIGYGPSKEAWEEWNQSQ